MGRLDAEVIEQAHGVFSEVGHEVRRLDATAGEATGLSAALAEFVDPSKTYAEQKQALIDRFTHVYLERVLQVTAGNQSEAARLSGLERSYLGKLVARLRLKRG